jgi:hypothetical protein
LRRARRSFTRASAATRLVAKLLVVRSLWYQSIQWLDPSGFLFEISQANLISQYLGGSFEATQSILPVASNGELQVR